MFLTLEIISANGDLLGNSRRKTIGPEGAKIGRALDNDWVINDKYISRLHAQVRYVNGAFYIEGLGRNPLALNDTAQTIPNNEPQILRSGDRVFLDEYEIRVAIGAQGTSAIGTPQVHDDPFGIVAAEDTARTTSPARSWDIPDAGSIGAGIEDASSADAGNLDPLAALGGPAPRRQAPLPPVNIHQGSVLENSYRPPIPVAAQPAGGGSQIPDSWDRSGFTQMGEQQPAPPPPRRPVPTPQGATAKTAAPPTPAGGAIPDAWDKSRLTRMDPWPRRHRSARLQRHRARLRNGLYPAARRAALRMPCATRSNDRARLRQPNARILITRRRCVRHRSVPRRPHLQRLLLRRVFLPAL